MNDALNAPTASASSSSWQSINDPFKRAQSSSSDAKSTSSSTK
jgi:hypothetical protein